MGNKKKHPIALPPQDLKSQKKVSVRQASEARNLRCSPRDIHIACCDGRIELIYLHPNRASGGEWRLVPREGLAFAVARDWPLLPTKNDPVKGWIVGALGPRVNLNDHLYLTEDNLSKLLPPTAERAAAPSLKKIKSHWKEKQATNAAMAKYAFENPVDEYHHKLRDKAGRPIATRLLTMMREYPGQYELPSQPGFSDGNILMVIRREIRKKTIK